MTHKLKTETFSQKIEYSGDVIFLPLTPLFSFVTFHLNTVKIQKIWTPENFEEVDGAYWFWVVRASIRTFVKNHVC